MGIHKMGINNMGIIINCDGCQKHTEFHIVDIRVFSDSGGDAMCRVVFCRCSECSMMKESVDIKESGTKFPDVTKFVVSSGIANATPQTRLDIEGILRQFAGDSAVDKPEPKDLDPDRFWKATKAASTP